MVKFANETEFKNVITTFVGPSKTAVNSITRAEHEDILNRLAETLTYGIAVDVDNLSATAAPTATDDSDSGYSDGSWWFDTNTNKAYILRDATVGAAVWAEVGGSAALHNLSATVDPAVTDDSAGGYSLGSFWFNGTSDKLFILRDPSVGAAVWFEIGGTTQTPTAYTVPTATWQAWADPPTVTELDDAHTALEADPAERIVGNLLNLDGSTRAYELFDNGWAAIENEATENFPRYYSIAEKPIADRATAPTIAEVTGDAGGTIAVGSTIRRPLDNGIVQYWKVETEDTPTLDYTQFPNSTDPIAVFPADATGWLEGEFFTFLDTSTDPDELQHYQWQPGDIALGVPTQIDFDGNQSSGAGSGSHPDLAAHDALGLATQTELDAHTGNVANPHAVTPVQIGVEPGANVNVQADWNETDNTSDAFIQNKPAIDNQQWADLVSTANTDADGSVSYRHRLDPVSGNVILDVVNGTDSPTGFVMVKVRGHATNTVSLDPSVSGDALPVQTDPTLCTVVSFVTDDSEAGYAAKSATFVPDQPWS